MNTKKKKVLLPGGIDNFHNLITHRDSEDNACIFVDKTLFIKSFIDASDKITLITRPRRFGKTLTLSMLEHFLAAEVGGQKTKGLFDGLKVSEQPETMRYQGEHPVIFLTLKSAKGSDYKEFFSRIREIIRDLYRTHRHLLEGGLAREDQAVFERFLNKEASRSEYQNSVRLLSELLYRYTGKRVYVLLDEYDTPINDGYVNGYYEECLSFLSSMFGETFKGNNSLERGLITGILKVAKASLFSELNNLGVYTMLSDDRYAHYFGFTEEETDDFLDRAGLSQKAHELKGMYNGYRVHNYTLYNPFSIVSFIKHALRLSEEKMQEALQPYWVNTGGTHLITDIIRHNVADLTAGLQGLLQEIPLKTPINEDITFNPHLKHNNVAFWSLLLLAGYLKVVNKTADIYGTYTYHLLFPNQEIKRAIRLSLMEILAGGLDYKDIYSMGMQALVKGDLEAFSTFMQRYMDRSPSYFDTGGPKKELFYHGLVLGMASVLSVTHHVISNRESGGGRYDIALKPKNMQGKGVLIELKVAGEGVDLGEVARAAHEQIATKAYATEMLSEGVQEILYVGIAFRDKRVEVVGGEPSKV